MGINTAMSKCFKHNIKCYPIKINDEWKIEYILKGKRNAFDKVLNNNKEINEALTKSYIYLANKIK